MRILPYVKTRFDLRRLSVGLGWKLTPSIESRYRVFDFYFYTPFFSVRLRWEWGYGGRVYLV